MGTHLMKTCFLFHLCNLIAFDYKRVFGKFYHRCIVFGRVGIKILNLFITVKFFKGGDFVLANARKGDFAVFFIDLGGEVLFNAQTLANLFNMKIGGGGNN